jgi:hypothetical protein
MLFNFKRFKKIAGLLILLMVSITLASFWEEITTTFNGYVDKGKQIIGIKEKIEQVEDDVDDVMSADSETKQKGIKVEGEVVVKTSDDEITVEIEKAQNDQERARGLMYRDSICENCGMLFYFDDSTRGGFWMKNCEISLDILFIDSDGNIIDIKQDFEPCRHDPCPTYTPKDFYRYALEVNGGWSEANGVLIGDSVEEID